MGSYSFYSLFIFQKLYCSDIENRFLISMQVTMRGSYQTMHMKEARLSLNTELMRNVSQCWLLVCFSFIVVVVAVF